MNPELFTHLTVLHENNTKPFGVRDDREFAERVAEAKQFMHEQNMVLPNGEFLLGPEVIALILKRDELNASIAFRHIFEFIGHRDKLENIVIEITQITGELSAFADDHHWSNEVKQMLDIS